MFILGSIQKPQHILRSCVRLALAGKLEISWLQQRLRGGAGGGLLTPGLHTQTIGSLLKPKAQMEMRDGPLTQQ